MPEKKVNKQTEIKASSDVFEIYLGTFIDNAFTWYSVKKFDNIEKAYKEYKTYVNTQLKYTDEELQKVWDTGRLDIELRQGTKLLNWVGIYSRKVVDLDTKSEKEAEKGKIKKDSGLSNSDIEIIDDAMKAAMENGDNYFTAFCLGDKSADDTDAAIDVVIDVLNKDFNGFLGENESDVRKYIEVTAGKMRGVLK